VVPQVNAIEPRRAYFSPVDDDRLLVVEANGRVGIWDLSGPARLFAALRAGAVDATFSPDGRHVATVSRDGRVRWWGSDGRLQWVSKTGHDGPARAVAVSDQLMVTGGEDGALRLWRLDGTPLGPPLKAHDNPVVSVDVSPRGDLVSLGGDEAVLLWKRTEGEEKLGTGTYESTVLYRPEKRRFGANFLNLLRFDVTWGWDHSVEFAPTGELIAGALFDGSLRLWDKDGRPRAVVEDAHTHRPVRSLSFSPRGDLVASAGFDGTLRLWNVDGSPQGGPINAHEGPAYSVSFSRDGERLASTGRDDRARGWYRDGAPAFDLTTSHPSQISVVALVADDAVLAVADDAGGVKTWSFDGTHRATLESNGKKPIQALAFGPRGETIAGGGAEGLVWRWGRDGRPRGGSINAKGPVAALAFEPSGQTLAVGSGTFQLWNHQKRLWQAPLRNVDQVTSIAFPPAGDSIVTGSLLGELQVWGLDGKSRAYRPKQGIEAVVSLVMTPQGDSFIAAFGTVQTVVQEFDLGLSPRGQPFEGHDGKLTGLAFSPDGRFVTSGEDGTVRLWTLPARQVQTIDVGLPIDQLGSWRNLLWVRADGQWLFFYETTGTLVATLLLDPNGVLAFTPDGWYAATSPPTCLLNLFDDSGAALSPAQVLARRSPERVMGAIVDRADGKQAPSNGAATR
jgi:WD40 repeat protein